MESAVLQPPRRRGGRPSKPDSERRDLHMQFRASAAERAEIEGRAAAAGVDVSSLIRAAVFGAPIRRHVSSHSPELVAQLRRAGNNVNQCLKEARIRNFPPDVAAAAEEALRDLSAAFRAVLHGPEH